MDAIEPLTSGYIFLCWNCKLMDEMKLQKKPWMMSVIYLIFFYPLLPLRMPLVAYRAIFVNFLMANDRRMILTLP